MALPSAASIEGAERVLTAPALAFVEDLTRRFRPRIDELLARRNVVQDRYNKGDRPNFLVDTADVRSADWRVGSIPADLQDRRVEITGPVDRKMIINALNSGASVFMADFEDATSPTWSNLVSGQANLIDAIRRTISYENPGTGKHYSLNHELATLMVRPRGFHLPERHCVVDGRPAPGMLFDFGLFLFHNAEALAKAGTGPYFYLPKMQSHLEARLWNDVFLHAQSALKIPAGTIKVTVLIETLPAAFEMDEILFELKDHIVGLNCGRWDYIFSAIKTLRSDPSFTLPDRGRSRWRRGSCARTPSCSSRPATGVARSRWAAWPRRFRSRTTPKQTRVRWRRCVPTNFGKCAKGTTARGWRILGWCSSRSRSSTRACPARTRSIAFARTSSRAQPLSSSLRRALARKPASVITYALASSISKPGWAGWARCPSTT